MCSTERQSWRRGKFPGMVHEKGDTSHGYINRKYDPVVRGDRDPAGARLTFVRDLGQDVAAMKADFRRAHHDMARRTKAERQGFVKDLGHEVASLMAGFHRAHKAMARQTKAERRAAVNHLKKTVGGMRREFSLDLAGAHRVWFGPSPAELQAKAAAARGPRPGRGRVETSPGSSRTGSPGRVGDG